MPAPSVVVTTAAQRRALESPLRLEILGHFTRVQPRSIADLAARMGRPAGSLYYHVRLLAKAKLLLPRGTRPAGKRPEQLYRLAAAPIAVAASNNDARGKSSAIKTVAAALRAVQRQYSAAVSSPRTRRDGATRNLQFMHANLAFRPALLREVNRRLTDIEQLIARETKRVPKSANDVEHCSLTLALTPIVNRGRQ